MLNLVRPLTFALLASLLTLSACQSARVKSFEKVQAGMEKDVVLEAIGNPTITRRWHGQDRWIYEFKNSSTTETREVHFLNGKAVYVGGAYVAAVAAEQQDQFNLRTNARALKFYQELEFERSRSAVAPHFEEIE